MASDIRKNFGNMCEGDKFATKLCMNIFHRKVSAVSLYAKNCFSHIRLSLWAGYVQ